MEIEIRKEKIWFVRHGDRTLAASCAECGGQMLTIDEAAQTAEFRTRAIFQMVEAGQIHFRETPKGLVLVCFVSLIEKNDPNGEEKKINLKE
jgi:hypothetical protein